MKKSNKFSLEVRQRAVRMVLEHRGKYPSLGVNGARPPFEELKAYIDQYRYTYGVEPICKVLQIAPSCYRRHAAPGVTFLFDVPLLSTIAN